MIAGQSQSELDGRTKLQKWRDQPCPNALGYAIPYHELLYRSQDVSSYAPRSLLQAAFIVTMMYGVSRTALLYLKRWMTRRQGRVVVRSAAVSGLSAAASDAPQCRRGIGCRGDAEEMRAQRGPWACVGVLGSRFG
ncbi:hypothetical protein [Paraburkholderia panacisoli]|uniref:hypothetical protein n=1 Tax=Paraburkholderia panacisoli TaxID=2603818 RepID=UPI001FE3BD00|nr:hypothetical protein [Paraburkholderia panacisoli]